MVCVALLKYETKIVRLLVVWLIIYSPILYMRMKGQENAIWELIFKTPAYLWYLTALIVAAIPFCFIKSRKALYCASAVLYMAGVLISPSYSWLTGGFPLYEEIFITSRNGVFFGLPLMCAGELADRAKHKSWVGLGMSAMLLCVEITFVGMNVNQEADRSMYLFLPLFIYFLISVIKEIGGEKTLQTSGVRVLRFI